MLSDLDLSYHNQFLKVDDETVAKLSKQLDNIDFATLKEAVKEVSYSLYELHEKNVGVDLDHQISKQAALEILAKHSITGNNADMVINFTMKF